MSSPLYPPSMPNTPIGTYNRQTTAANCNQWEYCRTVRNIARNAMNLPTAKCDYTLNLSDPDFMAIGTFLNVICQWDAGTGTYIGTRPWLGDKWNFKAISRLSNYVCNSNVSLTATVASGTPIVDNMEKEQYYIKGSTVAGQDGVRFAPTPTLVAGTPLVETKWVACKLLDHVSRDFKKIPLNTTEKNAVDALVAATTVATVGSEKNHKLGTKRYFGGVAGATVTKVGGIVGVSN